MELIGALIGLFFVSFLILPPLIFLFVLLYTKPDIDNNGLSGEQ